MNKISNRRLGLVSHPAQLRVSTFMAKNFEQRNAWNSWNPLYTPASSSTREAADSIKDGKEEDGEEEEDSVVYTDCEEEESEDGQSDKNACDIEELVDLTATVESAISKLRSAQQVVAQMCGAEAPRLDISGSCSGYRPSISMYHLNQSACEYEDNETDAQYCASSSQQPSHHCGQQLQQPSHHCGQQLQQPSHHCGQQPQQPSQHCGQQPQQPSHLCASSQQETDEYDAEGWCQSWGENDVEAEVETSGAVQDAQLSDCMAGAGGASEDSWRTLPRKSALKKKQPKENATQQTGRPRPQQLTTCQEDVIGQRLNASLQLLQGGPYQECDQCVKTLSSCDQNPLPSNDLLDRLNNLEMLLLYLQVHFRSQMSCTKLKLLCKLKKTLGCMHGFLLRRQAEETTEKVGQLHKWLDRTGNFRRHWRPVPSGGEDSRIVTDSADCVPRVAPEDEWLREFLPDSEKASLGHIVADSDPKVPENLGKRMAYSKLRGRSTWLHSTCARDSYEDLLRRFQFALR